MYRTREKRVSPTATPLTQIFSSPNGKHGHNSGAYADGHHLHRRPRARQGLLQAPPREREGEVLRLSAVVHLVADHLHTDVRESTCRRGLPVSLGLLFR